MAASFTCIDHIWKGEHRLQISANIWKVYCTLAGSVRTFHANFIYIRIDNFTKKSFCVNRQLFTESKEDF